jgi:basic amino acid/polyamine antiporter, APA family
MTTTVTADAPFEEDRPLFTRKATGLVRGWSAFDASIYAALVLSPVTFGFYIFSFAPSIPNGSLFWAAIISCAFICFEVLVYAALISAIPRAGGDYIWQTRLLHGSIGFVFPAVAWWFIMWHWAPIQANIMVREVVSPLLTTAGATGAATWFAGKDGTFVSCLIVVLVAGVYVALGLRGYATIQKWCFYAGAVGIVIVIGLLLFHSKHDFASAFNREAADLYGSRPNAYAQTLRVGGYDSPGLLNFQLGGIVLLMPLILFWNLWPNWGATLYGEVRGARDFRKSVIAMGGALVGMVLVTLILFVLIAKTMGWDWFNAANNAYLNAGTKPAPLAAWPYPIMFASWLVNNGAIQFIIITLVSCWFLGFLGSTYLSSTRVVFAAAFDRVLPEWVASVSKRGVPVGALVLMVVPSVALSALYAYSSDFATYTLDAAIVIAASYLFSALAAAVLPWRMKRVYDVSPLARWSVAGVPLLTVFSLIFAAFLIYAFVYWLKDAVYGVNNATSLIYLGFLYVLAIVIYVVARAVRARQGLSLDTVHHEIPVE